MSNVTLKRKLIVDKKIEDAKLKIAKIDKTMDDIKNVLSGEPQDNQNVDSGSAKKLLKLEDFPLTRIYNYCRMIKRDFDRSVLTYLYCTFHQGGSNKDQKILDFVNACVDKNPLNELVLDELSEIEVIEARFNTMKQCFHYFSFNTTPEVMKSIGDLQIKFQELCLELEFVNPFGINMCKLCKLQLDNLKDGKIDRNYFQKFFIDISDVFRKDFMSKCQEFTDQVWELMTPDQQKTIN